MREDDPRTAIDRDTWVEALDWYGVLHDAAGRNPGPGPGSPSACAWREWYADPPNRRAFDDMSRLLADRARYRARERPGKAQLEGDDYDLSVPIAEWRSRAQAVSRQPFCRPWRRWLAGGLGAAAIALLVAVWPTRFPGAPGGAAAGMFETGIGGMKEVHLHDGSVIILGGRTRLSVTFTAQRRSVRLIQGEGWFKVAHDPAWPFVVTAGNGTVTAVGTAFLVTRESDRVVVTVTEGAVEVSAARREGALLRLVSQFKVRARMPAMPVSEGEELAFTDRGAVQPLKPADAVAATAWIHGRLIFDDQPLRYVVETVNRYSLQHIVVSPDAGKLRFSGIVFDDDIDDWLKSLEVIFPITESVRSETVTIRKRPGASGSTRASAGLPD